ncbi:MAG: RluA family pseudouridine synthase [Bacteriovoracaceae bacterium]
MKYPPIKILFQDDYYIAVEKPSGVFVHPMEKRGIEERNNLLKRVKEQTGHYLYPVNRIDRPVSGVVLFALNKEATRKMQDIWKDDETKKYYITLCKGTLDEPGEFNFALKDDNGNEKQSRTTYGPIYSFGDITLCLVQIFTGRKHQIRRHFSRRCMNLLGDTTYGKGKVNHFFRDHFGLGRIFLHSSRLEFIHPFTNEKVKIYSELSEDLRKALKEIYLSYDGLLST